MKDVKNALNNGTLSYFFIALNCIGLFVAIKEAWKINSIIKSYNYSNLIMSGIFIQTATFVVATSSVYFMIKEIKNIRKNRTRRH